MGIKDLVVSVVGQSGISDVYAVLRRRVAKSRVAILMYHRVCPPKSNSFDNLSIGPQTFERQMEYLSKNHTILSLGKLSRYLQSRTPLPERAVTVTFDDGYKDNYRYAYPILRKYDIPATIFIVTGYVGTDKVFWWNKVSYIIHQSSIKQLHFPRLGNYSLRSEQDRLNLILKITERLEDIPIEIKNSLIKELSDTCHVKVPSKLGRELILSWKDVEEMSREGIDFGAHSVNHFLLPELSLEQAENEITQSKQAIEQRLGRNVVAFSYPNGKYNADVVEIVKRNGFACAVSVLHGKLIDSNDNVYKLSRIHVSEDAHKFKVMLSGLGGDLKVLRNHFLNRFITIM